MFFRRSPWWLRYVAVLALVNGGFVLRHNGLERWAALLDSVALTVLFSPLISRASRAIRHGHRSWR
jgi:hypothetical protein